MWLDTCAMTTSSRSNNNQQRFHVCKIIFSQKYQSCKTTKSVPSMSFHTRHTSKAAFIRLTPVPIKHFRLLQIQWWKNNAIRLNISQVCHHLITHSAQFLNNSSFPTFVSRATANAQYIPLKRGYYINNPANINSLSKSCNLRKLF